MGRRPAVPPMDSSRGHATDGIAPRALAGAAAERAEARLIQRARRCRRHHHAAGAVERARIRPRHAVILADLDFIDATVHHALAAHGQLAGHIVQDAMMLG
jgi:hypothetical protein